MRKRKPFIARYDGRCPECGDVIDEGIDEIVMTDEEGRRLSTVRMTNYLKDR